MLPPGPSLCRHFWWVSALRPGTPRGEVSFTHTSVGQCEVTTVQKSVGKGGLPVWF